MNAIDATSPTAPQAPPTLAQPDSDATLASKNGKATMLAINSAILSAAARRNFPRSMQPSNLNIRQPLLESTVGAAD
ncbi:hypothetical protein [Bradyrhizobium sp. AUGA SZCCT0182]|uniref:hypothetical protein n=1 Tax=Bradyrhizobium sp. AUGA SZCCT0182 TaxID=2807667 RepID=UPI001BA8306E|nr:hypothetical protein [Bradyrhizobium sp. AUGA SZCCT0182]MBR1233375.1 hypothetical protein [Bradyrhizobium sp. AUGA SZCCT0182]